VLFGAGSTETRDVTRIFGPLYVGKADFSARKLAHIITVVGHKIEDDLSVNDTTKARGLPNVVKIRPVDGTYGKWLIEPSPTIMLPVS
jgi:hypothetical protein